MRYQDLFEARQSPLYHYTSETNLLAIIASDELKAKGPGIYFTRSYARQFLAGDLFRGTWGLRVDQERLSRAFGRRLGPQGQTSWQEKDRMKVLQDPNQADRLTPGAIIQGARSQDIIRGDISRQARWENEELLRAREIKQFHAYVTGLVYAGGDRYDVYDQGAQFARRSGNREQSLDTLAELLLKHWQTPEKKQLIFTWLNHWQIPLVYQQQDYNVKEVQQAMSKTLKAQKAEKKRQEIEDIHGYVIVANKHGGGIVINGRDVVQAAQKALKLYPQKFPQGVLGIQILGGNGSTIWFDEPLTDPAKEPSF